MNFASTKQMAKRFALLSPPKPSPWYRFDSTTNKYTPLLRPRAGLKTFCNLPSSVQAMMSFAGRTFVIANNDPYELLPTGIGVKLHPLSAVPEPLPVPLRRNRASRRNKSIASPLQKSSPAHRSLKEVPALSPPKVKPSRTNGRVRKYTKARA